MKNIFKNITIITIIVFVVTIFINFQAQAWPSRYDQNKFYDRLNVVLVGDSYSAGNGAGSYRDNFNCYRSYYNWAEQYIDYLQDSGIPVNFTNEACSGAKTEHIHSSRENFYSNPISVRLPGKYNNLQQVRRNLGNASRFCEGFSASHVLSVHISPYFTHRSRDNSTVVSIHCRYALRPQAKAVNKDTDIVLMTISGNDVDFNSIVRYCFAFSIKGLCKPLIDRAETYFKKDATNNLHKTLDSLYANGLRNDAKIFFLGYPLLSLDMSYHIGLIGKYDAAQAVRRLGRLGNQAQANAIRSYKRKYPNHIIPPTPSTNYLPVLM